MNDYSVWYIQEKKLPHFVRSSLAMCPRRQEVQDVAPSCSVIVLSGHLVHPLTAMSRYVPAGHRAELPEKFPITLIHSNASPSSHASSQIKSFTL